MHIVVVASHSEAGRNAVGTQPQSVVAVADRTFAAVAQISVDRAVVRFSDPFSLLQPSRKDNTINKPS